VGRHDARLGVSNIQMHLDTPLRVEVTGDRAYEVARGVVTLEGKGPPLHESGMLTFALQRSAGAWKIGLMSWGGEAAKP
jgi:ketosteroid isomerase-like protein